MPTTERKTALVTGASSGIGRHAAIRIAERGARAIVTYNGNPEGAAETVAMIEERGGEAVAMHLDVGRSETFAAFAAELGDDPLHYLVHNAGFGGPSMFEETTEELYDAFHRVLLKGPYFLTQTLLPVLADGGAIVNVTSGSVLPITTEPGYSTYAAMKGGLAVLTRYLAKELSPRRIRVNAVAPGPTRTRLGGDAFEHFPDVIPPLVERTALGRLGEGDDIGKVIAALLSDECAWITGEQIEVSGGYGL
jgi:NAD(P)-dependent dehydrogenase (short-subunit alcohol dehydrogenase family)